MQHFFLRQKISLGMLFYCISFSACLFKGEEQTLLYFSLIQQAFWSQSSKSFKRVLKCNVMKFKFIVLPMYLTLSMGLSALSKAGPEWWKTLKIRPMHFYTHNFKPLILLKVTFSTAYAMKIQCSPPPILPIAPPKKKPTNFSWSDNLTAISCVTPSLALFKNILLS